MGKITDVFAENIHGVCVIKPPKPIPPHRESLFLPNSIFLAGSIEMGKAEDWQTKVTKEFLKRKQYKYILNPRRDDWDSSWTQEITNPQFYEQVSWELTGMEIVEDILVYFDPKSTSPITLMELGIHSQSGKLKVVCPDGFFRKGNVEIVCKHYGNEFFDTLDEYFESLDEF